MYLQGIRRPVDFNPLNKGYLRLNTLNTADLDRSRNFSHTSHTSTLANATPQTNQQTTLSRRGGPSASNHKKS